MVLGQQRPARRHRADRDADVHGREREERVANGVPRQHHQAAACVDTSWARSQVAIAWTRDRASPNVSAQPRGLVRVALHQERARGILVGPPLQPRADAAVQPAAAAGWT